MRFGKMYLNATETQKDSSGLYDVSYSGSHNARLDIVWLRVMFKTD